jgi:hypothetical protein
MIGDMTNIWVRELANLYDNGKPFLFGVLITLLAWLGFNWAMILERIMSRRSQRKVHKQEMAEVADGISYLLEAMANAQKLRPVTKKRLIRKLASLGVKDVGTEPTFGTPKHSLAWADPRPSINLLKVQIAERLPKGVMAKFWQRRPEPKKQKIEGVLSFLNDLKRSA